AVRHIDADNDAFHLEVAEEEVWRRRGTGAFLRRGIGRLGRQAKGGNGGEKGKLEDVQRSLPVYGSERHELPLAVLCSRKTCWRAGGSCDGCGDRVRGRRRGGRQTLVAALPDDSANSSKNHWLNQPDPCRLAGR